MTTAPHIILASQSPYRKTLLQSTGLVFTTQTAPIDEQTVEHTDPLKRAELRAEAKALSVLHLNHQAIVIGCDQVAALGPTPFDKAHSLVEARQRLESLSGKTHHLYSAWAIARYDHGIPRVLMSQVEVIAMPMRELSAAEIEAYLKTNEWQGCVGCYQFENKGVNLFTGVQADSSAIMGLPLQPLLAALRSLNYNPLTP